MKALRGSVQRRSGDLEGARATLDDASRHCPESVAVLRERVEIAERLGRLEEGARLVKRCLEPQPGDEGLRLLLAKLSMQLGRREDAIAIWRKVEEANPFCREANVRLLEHVDLSGKPAKAPSRAGERGSGASPDPTR